MAVTSAQATAAVIESGRVLDVDISTYTLTVTTQFTKKPQSGISFATPYQHFVNGEGIYFMPEVGSVCWICFPSDGQRPFVLAWGPAQDEGDFRGKKKDLNPGDIYLGTRDENFLVLRRGGVVQIGGGPLNQRIFLPINNTIKDICENYSLSTLAGDLEWSIGRNEDTTDGKRPGLFALRAREFADDAQPIAELLIGSHSGDDKTILSLLVKDSGSDGAAQKVELKFTKEGTVEWTVRKDVVWTVDGKWSLEVKGDASLVSKTGKVSVFASAGAVEVDGKTGVKVNSAAQIELAAPLVKVGQKMSVGSGPQFPVLLATPELLIWFAAHIHTSTAPGTPTSPPAAPPPLVSATSKVTTSS